MDTDTRWLNLFQCKISPESGHLAKSQKCCTALQSYDNVCIYRSLLVVGVWSRGQAVTIHVTDKGCNISATGNTVGTYTYITHSLPAQWRRGGGSWSPPPPYFLWSPLPFFLSPLKFLVLTKRCLPKGVCAGN